MPCVVHQALMISKLLPPCPGDCLLDAPADPLSLPAELPGQGALYSLDQQCQQIFGKDFQHCPNTTEEDICAQLWCRTGGGEPLCHTKNGSLPWADGTPCKADGLCWDGRCVPQDALKPQVRGRNRGPFGIPKPLTPVLPSPGLAWDFPDLFSGYVSFNNTFR